MSLQKRINFDSEVVVTQPFDLLRPENPTCPTVRAAGVRTNVICVVLSIRVPREHAVNGGKAGLA